MNKTMGLFTEFLEEGMTPEEKAARRAEIADRKAAYAERGEVNTAPQPKKQPRPQLNLSTPKPAPAEKPQPVDDGTGGKLDDLLAGIQTPDNEGIKKNSKAITDKTRPTKNPAVPSSGRATSNFNFAELLVGGSLAYPDAENFEQLRQKDLSLMNVSGLDKYLKDVDTRDPRLIKETMNNFRRLSNERGMRAENPQDVYIRNTNQSLLPAELKDSIEAMPDRARADKADVLFKNQDQRFKGVSVKDDPKNWESSYSINKMMNQISDENGLTDTMGNPMMLGEQLEDVRRQMMEEAGLPTSELNWKQNNPDDPAGWKALRDENKFNELYFDDKNAYHERARELIDQYGPQVKKYMLDGLYPRTPYDMMLFNQTGLTDLNRDDFNENDMDLHHIENPAKKPRGAAKSFMAAQMKGEEDPFKLMELRLKTPFSPHHFVTSPWDNERHNFRPLQR
jgi:hypothetical protein